MGNFNTTRENINAEVNVTALYFSGSKNFKSFPKRIEYRGQELTFVESGMQYLVQQGQNFIKLFDMSDGVFNYRLRFDPSTMTWTLIHKTQLPREAYWD